MGLGFFKALSCGLFKTRLEDASSSVSSSVIMVCMREVFDTCGDSFGAAPAVFRVAVVELVAFWACFGRGLGRGGSSSEENTWSMTEGLDGWGLRLDCLRWAIISCSSSLDSASSLTGS